MCHTGEPMKSFTTETPSAAAALGCHCQTVSRRLRQREHLVIVRPDPQLPARDASEASYGTMADNG